MSALNAELNPIYIDAKSIKLLTQAAVSDAKHDFGGEFASIFEGIFNGKRFKNIGTALMPSDMEIKQEHKTLDIFLNEDPTNRLIHDATGDKWKANLFPRDAPFEYETPEFTLHPDFNPPGAAPIHKYQLITRKFDEEAFNSQVFFEFLRDKLKTSNNIYVQQDAGSISYNDKFSGKDREEDNPPLTEPQYFFNYLNSREGQNDAAGKTGEDNPAVKKSEGKKVRVQIKEEEKNDKGKDREVFYGNLPDETFFRNIPVTRNFNSIYNIEISPIILETKEEVEGGNPVKKQKKTARVSMYFRDDKNELIGSTNKGKRENAKSTLKSILETFFKKLTGKGQKETAPYFQSLQQKRGGDWLQCLATFDKKRFGLNEDDTIILFTHDLICLAYALANGLHVLFSFSTAAYGKRIMLFRNNNRLLSKGIPSFIKEIDNLTKIVRDLLISIPNELQAYARSREKLIDDLDKKITAKRTELLGVEGGAPGTISRIDNVATLHKDVRAIIRDLLKVFFEYSYFVNMFPPVDSFCRPYYTVTLVEGGDPTVVKDVAIISNYNDEDRTGKFFDYKTYFLNLLKEVIYVDNIDTLPVWTGPDNLGAQKDAYTALFNIIKTKGRAEYTSLEEFTTKNILTNEQKKLLETIDYRFFPRGELRGEMDAKIKELEGFISGISSLKKHLQSYKITVGVGVSGIDINKLINLSKKIKSKDNDDISIFLNNINPFPLNAEAQPRRPANRFGIPSLVFGRSNNIKEQNEKSETDYSVFNYFIGKQLPDGLKTSLQGVLTSIQIKMNSILTDFGPELGGEAAIKARQRNDLKASIKLYDNFLKEVEFYLNKDKSWSYEYGLSTDVLEKLTKYYEQAGGGGGVGAAAAAVGADMGGGNRVMVGGEISKVEKNLITLFLIEQFPSRFENDESFTTEFLNQLHTDLGKDPIKGLVKDKIQEARRSEATLNDSDYDELINEYIEAITDDLEAHITSMKDKIAEGLRKKKRERVRAAFVAEAAAIKRLTQRKEQLRAAKNFFSDLFGVRRGTGAAAAAASGASSAAASASGAAAAASGAAPDEIPLEASDVDALIDDYFREAEEIDKQADATDKNENVILSTPEALYMDILMKYRETFRPHLPLAINTKLDDKDLTYEDKITLFRERFIQLRGVPEFRAAVEEQTRAATATAAAADEAALAEARAAAAVAEQRIGEAFVAGQDAFAAADAEARRAALAEAEAADAQVEGAGGAAAAAEGGGKHSGGARTSLSVDSVEVPYLGWTTLYFYGLSLLQELENTNHAEDGMDFDYLARQGQFFISMVQSMFTHLLPKSQGGGRGQGSPNQSTGSTVMTVTPENALTKARREKVYKTQIEQRGDEIQRIMKTYVMGNQCDLFLTNILPRLDFIEDMQAQKLKELIFQTMGVGYGYGWIAYFSGIQNDFFFGSSMDRSLDSQVDLENSYLKKFVQTTLETLRTMPQLPITDEAKQQIETQIKDTLKKLLRFLNTTEHEFVKNMYQEVLISRAELKQATAQATRKIQTFNNQRKNRNTLTKEINKILSYTFEDFSNMTFLIQNRLLKGQGKTIRTLPREFDSALHSRLLRTIPNGLQKFEAIQPKLQADPALKQKYIQRIKNLDTYKKQKNREKYNRAWKGLQDFLQNPENTTLLNMSGGTRKKKKVLRLKSRRRTHKKI